MKNVFVIYYKMLLFHRFLHVYKPLLVMRLNMIKYAKISVTIITIVAIVITIPQMAVYQPIQKENGHFEVIFNRMVFGTDQDDFHQIKNVIDIAIFNVLPLYFIIIPINTAIIILLATRQKDLKMNTDKTKKKEDKSTVMLVTVAVVFTILNMPTVVEVWMYVTDNTSFSTLMRFLGYTGRTCAAVNCSVNVMIYFLIGSAFRKKLVNLLYRGRDAASSTVSETSVTTMNK